LIGLAVSRLSFLRTGLALLSRPSWLRGRRVLEGDRDLEPEGRLLVLLFRRGGESDREDKDESESELDVPEEESLSLSLSDDDDELEEVNEINVRPEHDNNVIELRMIKIQVLTRMIFAFVSCPCSSSRPTSVELLVQPRSYPLGLSCKPQQRFLMSHITATLSLVGLLTWS
jgi:hypothetical protein